MDGKYNQVTLPMLSPGTFPMRKSPDISFPSSLPFRFSSPSTILHSISYPHSRFFYHSTILYILSVSLWVSLYSTPSSALPSFLLCF